MSQQTAPPIFPNRHGPHRTIHCEPNETINFKSDTGHDHRITLSGAVQINCLARWRANLTYAKLESSAERIVLHELILGGIAVDFEELPHNQQCHIVHQLAAKKMNKEWDGGTLIVFDETPEAIAEIVGYASQASTHRALEGLRKRNVVLTAFTPVDGRRNRYIIPTPDLLNHPSHSPAPDIKPSLFEDGNPPNPEPASTGVEAPERKPIPEIDPASTGARALEEKPEQASTGVEAPERKPIPEIDPASTGARALEEKPEPLLEDLEDIDLLNLKEDSSSKEGEESEKLLKAVLVNGERLHPNQIRTILALPKSDPQSIRLAIERTSKAGETAAKARKKFILGKYLYRAVESPFPAERTPEQKKFDKLPEGQQDQILGAQERKAVEASETAKRLRAAPDDAFAQAIADAMALETDPDRRQRLQAIGANRSAPKADYATFGSLLVRLLDERAAINELRTVGEGSLADARQRALDEMGWPVSLAWGKWTVADLLTMGRPCQPFRINVLNHIRKAHR